MFIRFREFIRSDISEVEYLNGMFIFTITKTNSERTIVFLVGVLPNLDLIYKQNCALLFANHE